MIQRAAKTRLLAPKQTKVSNFEPIILLYVYNSGQTGEREVFYKVRIGVESRWISRGIIQLT